MSRSDGYCVQTGYIKTSHHWSSELFFVMADRIEMFLSNLGSPGLKTVSESPLANQPGILNYIAVWENMNNFSVESLRFETYLLQQLDLPELMQGNHSTSFSWGCWTKRDSAYKSSLYRLVHGERSSPIVDSLARKVGRPGPKRTWKRLWSRTWTTGCIYFH